MAIDALIKEPLVLYVYIALLGEEIGIVESSTNFAG
jgi:hypothetical protein